MNSRHIQGRKFCQEKRNFLLQSMFVETQPKSGKQFSSWTQLIKAFLFQSKLQYNISNQILIYRQNLLKKILKFKVLYLIYSPHVGVKDSYKILCQYLYASLHQAVNLCLLILGKRLLIFKHRSNHKTNFFNIEVCVRLQVIPH